MLGKVLPSALDKRFDTIYLREQMLSESVASEMLGQDQVKVKIWKIMIPIVLVYDILRAKRLKKGISMNLMFTKKIALEAAYEILKGTESREEALARIEGKLSNMAASDKKGIYSNKVLRAQMKEIDLLIEHYQKLLKAEGKDYASLVGNAYGTREDYVAFLEQLKRAEKGVNRVARETVKVEDGSEITSKMQKARESARMAEVKQIFGEDSESLDRGY